MHPNLALNISVFTICIYFKAVPWSTQ